MVGAILELLQPLYSNWTGYLLVAVLVLVDRAAFTGVFLPGELFMALGGVFAARGELALAGVIAVGAVAGIAGETTSYLLGRRYGTSITKHIPLLNRFNKHLDRANRYFEREGGRTVFIGRYVSVVGAFMPFAAGMSEMKFFRFLAFDVAALVSWAAALGLLGYFMASQIETVDRIISRFGWGLLLLVLLYFGGRAAWKRRDRIEERFRSKKGSSRGSRS